MARGWQALSLAWMRTRQDPQRLQVMNEKKPTRKEREREARSHLILDIARDLIARDGFAELSMHAIAEVAEYSKGTIYLHYGSRESVLVALCIRALRSLEALQRKVAGFDAPSREKILASKIAHQLFSQLYPVESACLPLVKSPSISEKIESAEHKAFDRAVGAIADYTARVIEGAIEAGDLALPDDVKPEDLAFSLFTLHGGNLMLCQNAFLVREKAEREECYSNVDGLIFNAVLDGLGWKPHSSRFDEEAATRRILETLFEEERARLAQNGGPGN
jgi:AcrR family transcriptional regulator